MHCYKHMEASRTLIVVMVEGMTLDLMKRLALISGTGLL
tara:strand:- start:641 stop:757 length:117 start_codon:yes stop_codon:yes gene_type:complete